MKEITRFRIFVQRFNMQKRIFMLPELLQSCLIRNFEKLITRSRRSRSEVFRKKGAIINFVKFIRKQLCLSRFFNKVAGQIHIYVEFLYLQCPFTEHINTLRNWKVSFWPTFSSKIFQLYIYLLLFLGFFSSCHNRFGLAKPIALNNTINI